MEEEEEEAKDKNPLLASLSTETTEEKKERKAELWFQKIGDIERYGTTAMGIHAGTSMRITRTN
jgi:hypothetical protein